MSQSVVSSPITIDHPAVGRIRLLASFPTYLHDFLTDMIANGDIRCILHEGCYFVVLKDVEPYSATEEPDGDDLPDPVILSASAVAELLQAVKKQADTAVQAKRARLVDSLPQALRPTTHPFAQFSWSGFWRDVAHVGASVAGEAEAQRINEAFAALSASAENGTLETIGLPSFHRVMLSLVHPDLEQQFDDIWSVGQGRLDMFQDPQERTRAVAILSRLTAMYSGYRGTPEGSQTPQLTMDAYLQIVKL